MFICIEITKHWRLSLVQVRNAYQLLEFRFSTRGERDTIFTMLTVSKSFFSQLPSWTALAQVQISTNCFFQKLPKIPAPRFRAWCHSHTSPIFYLGFLLWHLWLSRPLRASVNTCSKSWIVQSLTKRNDKI